MGLGDMMNPHAGSGAEGHVGQQEKFHVATAVVPGRDWQPGPGNRGQGGRMGMGLGQVLMELPRHAQD